MALPTELDVELEMNKITLAGMSGEEQLQESIKVLTSVYEVTDASPEPIDIAKEMQQLVIQYMSGTMDDAQRDTRLKAILSKALTAKDKQLGEPVGDSTQAIS